MSQQIKFMFSVVCHPEINSGDIKAELLLCSALETTTKADDVMEKVSTCVVFVQIGHRLCWLRHQYSIR